MSSFLIGKENELESAFILRDVRPFRTRLSDYLKNPDNLKLVWFIGAFALFVFPMLVPVAAIPALYLGRWQAATYGNLRLPIRLPMWTRIPDPSNKDDKREGALADGVSFLGVTKKHVRKSLTHALDQLEIWLSDSDVRVHKLVMAATGGGKTNTLLSWATNTIACGSGYTYSDGKAQNDVFTNIYHTAYALWREDDVLVINFMTGDEDSFVEELNKKTSDSAKKRKSNSFNPFSFAPADTINNLLQSLLAKATGDGASWQNKAIAMVSGVVNSVCYLRAVGDVRVSVKTIRHYIALPSLIELWKRGREGHLPDSAIAPVNAYLSVGLPGFDQNKALEGKPQAQQPMDQHGFLSGQFSPALAMLADGYGYIFNDVTPEVDMTDNVLNNRICAVLIPSLRKSEQEASNLGKLVVSAAKMMMGANLGSDIEGSVLEIVMNKPTNCDSPYEFVLDELGYYFAPGVDLMFAQGRSLGIGMTGSGQDFQAMSKTEGMKNPVESMIANARLKVALATEDPKETFEIINKSAGQAYVARASGFEHREGLMGSGRMRPTDQATVEKMDKVSLEELRALPPGDGIILYKDQVIRANLFNIFSDFKPDINVNIRINTMLPIRPYAALEMLQLNALDMKERHESEFEMIQSIINAGATPIYHQQTDDASARLAMTLASTSARLLDRNDLSAAEKGILLWMGLANEIRGVSKVAADGENEFNPENAPVLYGLRSAAIDQVLSTQDGEIGLHQTVRNDLKNVADQMFGLEDSDQVVDEVVEDAEGKLHDCLGEYENDVSRYVDENTMSISNIEKEFDDIDTLFK